MMSALLPGVLGNLFDLDKKKSEDIVEAAGRALSTGRQFLAVEDATYLVSTGTLALGIIFIITTIALYAYYYATTFDFTDAGVARSLGGVNRDGTPSVYSFSTILNDIESAFKKYGVESEECKKKVVCESQLTDARSKNAKVADYLSDLISRALDRLKVNKDKASTPEQEKLDKYIRAARSGHHFKTCSKYLCTTKSLELIPK